MVLWRDVVEMMKLLLFEDDVVWRFLCWFVDGGILILINGKEKMMMIKV